MRTDELIVQLARAASPIRPLPPPGVRAMRWVAAALFVMAVAIVLVGPRADLAAAPWPTDLPRIVRCAVAHAGERGICRRCSLRTWRRALAGAARPAGAGGRDMVGDLVCRVVHGRRARRSEKRAVSLGVRYSNRRVRRGCWLAAVSDDRASRATAASMDSGRGRLGEHGCRSCRRASVLPR